MQHRLKESVLRLQFVFFYLIHHWTQSHTRHKRRHDPTIERPAICASVCDLYLFSLCLSPDSRASLSRSSKPSRWTDKPVSGEEQLQPKAHLANVESFALMYRKTRFYTTPAQSLPSLMMINRFVYMCMCLWLRYHRRNLYNITVSDTQQPQEYHSSVTDW